VAAEGETVAVMLTLDPTATDFADVVSVVVVLIKELAAMLKSVVAVELVPF
jgi:hypothetical protein